MNLLLNSKVLSSKANISLKKKKNFNVQNNEQNKPNDIRFNNIPSNAIKSNFLAFSGKSLSYAEKISNPETGTMQRLKTMKHLILDDYLDKGCKTTEEHKLVMDSLTGIITDNTDNPPIHEVEINGQKFQVSDARETFEYYNANYKKVGKNTDYETKSRAVNSMLENEELKIENDLAGEVDFIGLITPTEKRKAMQLFVDLANVDEMNEFISSKFNELKLTEKKDFIKTINGNATIVKITGDSQDPSIESKLKKIRMLNDGIPKRKENRFVPCLVPLLDDKNNDIKLLTVKAIVNLADKKQLETLDVKLNDTLSNLISNGDNSTNIDAQKVLDELNSR